MTETNAVGPSARGSGKQSITRLAAYTAGCDVFSVTLTRGYNEALFREDLKSLYGMIVDKPVAFLFTDNHVADEGFLELINNMLSIVIDPAAEGKGGAQRSSLAPGQVEVRSGSPVAAARPPAKPAPTGGTAERAAAPPPEAAKPAPPEPRKFASEHRLQSGGTDIAYTSRNDAEQRKKLPKNPII